MLMFLRMASIPLGAIGTGISDRGAVGFLTTLTGFNLIRCHSTARSMMPWRSERILRRTEAPLLASPSAAAKR